MKKILLILLLLVSTAKAQISPFSFMGGGEFALDFDGSTEYLSCTPALRLTGEYSLWDNFSDGNYDGWTVSSGAYSVVDSTPLSGGTKALKCTTAGIISIPCNQAYGQWEFDYYKGADFNASFIMFESDLIGAYGGANGYLWGVNSSEQIFSYRNTGTPVILSASSVSYISINRWYRVKITRNTNGQFYFYIKGGSFGTDYILAGSTSSGTNPATDNTYTSSNFFVLDLDANDMIANIVCQQGEGSLDLNSYERIYHADNRNMTKTGGYSWNGNGTHSIDTTSTDKRTGTYSSKIISTDVGDSTTNYINLPSANFDTLKQDANGIYEKYTLEGWARGVGVLGSDLASGWDFTSGWSSVGATVVDSNSFSTVDNGGLYKSILTIGKTYQLVFNRATTATSCDIYNYAGNDVNKVTNGSGTFYFIALQNALYLRNVGVGQTDVTTLTIQEVTQPSLTLRIGNQTKTITGISCVPATFTKFVFNFQSNSLVSNQDIKMWVNQADTVYVDDVSLTKSYDVLINTFVKTTDKTGGILNKGVPAGGVSNIGYEVYMDNTDYPKLFFSDGNTRNSVASTSSVITGGTSYYSISYGVDRVGNSSAYVNGTSGGTLSMVLYGNMNIVSSLEIGKRTTNYLTFQLGHTSITKFTDISQSNVNSTTLTAAYNRGKLIQNEWTGGSPIEVAFYDWKGSTINEALTDKSGTGNNLSGTNITLDDRVKVKFK